MSLAAEFEALSIPAKLLKVSRRQDAPATVSLPKHELDWLVGAYERARERANALEHRYIGVQEYISSCLAERVAPAAGTADTDVERYCVIGVEAYKRTWVRTIDSAIGHARALFGPNSAKKLLVVKVVKVLESPAPVIAAREPQERDFDSYK